MKKILSLLGLLLIASSFQNAPPVYAQNESVIITNVQGGPVIMRQGQAIPASVGMACEKDDVLVTNADCVLDIAVNNIAGCRLLASSECAVMNTDLNAMHLKINNGNAVLNLKKLPAGSAFRLETPTAIAGVRGTQFWGRVDLKEAANPVTTFAVREGAVEIFSKSAGKNFTLNQGEALDLSKDASVLPVIRPALAEELAAMAQADAIKTSA